MGADVVEEVRGGEAAAQRDRALGQQHRRPQAHQRVAVEQRHAGVAGVGGGEPELLAELVPGPGQPPLAADHRLGRAGRSGGEGEQHPGAGVRQYGGRRRVPVGREQVGVPGLVDHQHPLRQRRGGEQRQQPAFGDQQRAVGVLDVAVQVGPAPGGVDADGGGPGQRAGLEPVDVLRGVLQQQPDVRVPGGRQQVAEQRGPGAGGPQYRVLGVAEAVADQARPEHPALREHGLGQRRRWRSCGHRRYPPRFLTDRQSMVLIPPLPAGRKTRGNPRGDCGGKPTTGRTRPQREGPARANAVQLGRGRGCQGLLMSMLMLMVAL